MNHNNVVFVFLVLGWICLIGECGVLRSHITGGYKHSQLKDSASELDCSQFIDDHDIIRQFPFPVLINPSEYIFNQSIVTMDKNNTFVQEIYICEEEVVPSSVFCLSNLQILTILETPFQDGIVPDALANLKQLQEILVYSSPIVKITELLVTLPNISILLFNNCSLTHIQNLDKLDKLWSLELPNNHLSHIEGIPAVAMLRLGGNLFTEIPTTKDKDKLRFLVMNNNPLTNAMPILSYKNLEEIDLENATLTSIPAAIDKLQKLDYLHLANNKISHFPTSIFNLRHLEDFTIHNNLLSPNDIKSIREAFKKSHPNTYVSI